MAQKKHENKDIEDIKDLLGSEKLIFGSDRALKSVREGELAKVYLAKNAPAKLKDDLEYYKKLSEFEIVNLDISSEELGIVCRKPFLISAVSLLK